MYENPRTLFQQKVSNILKKEYKSSALFENIFKLQQLFQLEKFPNSERKDFNDWKTLLEVYNAVGAQTFAKLISIVKGKTLQFPTEEDFQDSIVTTLCYYYKEVEQKTWEDIKGLLNMPKLNTIKFGIRVRQLNQFIQSQILHKLSLRK
jgi:hypothetical protein